MTVFTTSEQSLAGTNIDLINNMRKRGINVYTMNEVIGIAGRAKDGEMLQGTIEQPLFSLSLYDRFNVYQRCDPVFGCVTSRANRISAQKWQIVRKSKIEDRIAEQLKQWAQLYNEYKGQISGIIACAKFYQYIKHYLPDCFPDLSNFQAALLRWRKRIRVSNDDRSEEVADWLQEPNLEDDFDDFLKKWVTDLMVHGNFAIYKERNEDQTIENFYGLPGGTTVPLRNRYVGGPMMYAQMIPGEDPKIYFGDEISMCKYMPSTAIAFGMIPLEALVNKIAESLFFDSNAAQRADGTIAPNKAVLFGDTSPFGDAGLTNDQSLQLPLDKAEQAKLETIFNEPRKNAIRVISGYGTPAILDLSRDDIFATQSERQKYIRECVAFVFNMSNMEVNLTGSDDTSGRSTSDAQGDIDKEKGIAPINKTIAMKINRDLLPGRFGSDYEFEFSSGISDDEQLDLDTKKVQSQTYSINEVRRERGDEPFPGDQFELPQDQKSPDGSEGNPLMTKAVE